MKDSSASPRQSMQVIISLAAWDQVTFRGSADVQKAYAKAVFTYMSSQLSSEHSLSAACCLPGSAGHWILGVRPCFNCMPFTSATRAVNDALMRIFNVDQSSIGAGVHTRIWFSTEQQASSNSM